MILTMRAQEKDLGLSHENLALEHILLFILDETNESFLDILAKIHKMA
jgi:hypothetical protein